MSRMPIINFDEHFADYTSAWMKEHQGEYATYDEMEADLPKVYMMFLNTRAAWLGSLTPGSYFTQFEDPKVLVDWMHEYCRQGVPVPDLLTEQITFVGKPCEKRLLELLKDPEAGEEASMLAVGLLREMGETAVQPMLQAVREANAAGQEALLDVLSNYPGNEQIFQLAIRLFRDHPEKRALFAGYLARIGDPRALTELEEAAREKEMSYLTFIEIRNAIEELGGECPEREFEEDPEYDALRGMDLT